MPLLKEYLFCGAGFYLERLDILTAVGRRKLNSLELASETEEIQKRLQIAADYFKFAARRPDGFARIRATVARCRDILQTLRRLALQEILDEIELFEIKQLAFLCKEIRSLLTDVLEKYQPPDLTDVITILDPDHTNIPSFYLYDSYSEELRKCRQAVLKCDSDEGRLSAEQAVADEEIRLLAGLSERLQPYARQMSAALECLAEIDFEAAKACLAKEYSLCCPEAGRSGIRLKAAFNAEVKEALAAKGRNYQPVDVELHEGVCLLTGANMTGKSVLLKMLAAIQVLFQAGFFVPAEKAEIQPVSEIFLLSGDLQSADSGLSSYAAEILYADRAVRVSGSEKTLVLLDELARTTNPHEGRAIVAAVVRLLEQSATTALVTTHYPAINSDVRRMKVKGIKVAEIPCGADIARLGEYIDYSLEEDDGGSPPEEALRIAEIIGVSPELINNAREQL